MTTTTCPKCARPVRKAAKFCGYCGASLIPQAPNGSNQATLPFHGEAAGYGETKASQRGNFGRALLIIVIIILCLLIAGSLVVNFYPNLFPGLLQNLSMIKIL